MATRTGGWKATHWWNKPIDSCTFPLEWITAATPWTNRKYLRPCRLLGHVRQFLFTFFTERKVWRNHREPLEGAFVSSKSKWPSKNVVKVKRSDTLRKKRDCPHTDEQIVSFAYRCNVVEEFYRLWNWMKRHCPITIGKCSQWHKWL